MVPATAILYIHSAILRICRNCRTNICNHVQHMYKHIDRHILFNNFCRVGHGITKNYSNINSIYVYFRNINKFLKYRKYSKSFKVLYVMYLQYLICMSYIYITIDFDKHMFVYKRSFNIAI